MGKIRSMDSDEIQGENHRMNKKDIIVELKKTLKNIYEEFEKRIDRSTWKSAVSGPYKMCPEETARATVEFVMTHDHIPAGAVRSLFQAVELRNRPASLSEIYSVEIVRKLCNKMVNVDPVRYSLIPSDLPKEKLDKFIDAAKEADLHLNKRQLYLAEKKIFEAEQICGDHPDIELMRARAAYLRFDFSAAERILDHILSSSSASADAYELSGDIYMSRKNYPKARDLYIKAKELSGSGCSDAALSAKADDAALNSDRLEHSYIIQRKEIDSLMADAKRFERSGSKKKAEQIYQGIIAKDYRQFAAYYPLGKIFLEEGKTEEADYLAEILLDFDADTVKAQLLKGMVLEACGKQEDALFYYNAAAASEPDDLEAFCHKKRLTAVLDRDDKLAAEARQALSNLDRLNAAKGSSDSAGSETDKERKKAVAEIDESIDDLLQRGRMTEAYYDLIKKGAEYPNSAVLAYKRAVILCLMNRDIEARKILSELRENEEFREKAEDFIYDIDCKIVGEHKETDVEYDVLPEIYFNIGKYESCEDAISQVKEDKLTPGLMALRGRCEVSQGRFSDALKSFDAALAADKNLKGLRIMKGMILQSKRDYEGALSMYDEALKAGDDPVSVCSIKAALLYEQERNAELLVFRSDVAKMPVRSYDVDGYTGLVYMKRTPHDEKKGVDFLENAMSAGSKNVEFYIAAVRAYLSEEKYHAALSAAEAGLSAVPSSKELFGLKAETLFMLGKFESAEMIAGTLLSEDLRSGELHYLLGRIESEKGNEKDALKWLKSAAELEPKNHTYIYAYADKCFETGDKRNAEMYYTKAIELNPRDYISLKRRAILLEERGEDDAAASDVKASLAIRPNDAEAYVILGNIISLYDIEEAAEEIEDNEECADDRISDDGNSAEEQDRTEKAAAENTEKAAVDNVESGAEAETEETSRNTDKSEKNAAFSETSSKEAPQTSSGGDEAGGKAGSEDGEEASASMEHAAAAGQEKQTGASAEPKGTDKTSGSEKKEHRRAHLRRHSSDKEGAHEVLREIIEEFGADPEFYFNKAISIDPKYRQSYISLAKYKAENGRYDQAMKDVERAISLNPEMTDGYMVKGIICHLRGDNHAAITNFREIVMREADNLRAYSYISKCCNAAGRYQEAAEAADRGIAINGDYVNLYVNKGVALYHMEKYDEAIEAFRKVITNQNIVNTAAVESAYRFRGMAYEKIGNTEKALSDYQKLLRYNPDRKDIKKRVSEMESKIDDAKPKSRLASIFRRKK